MIQLDGRQPGDEIEVEEEMDEEGASAESFRVGAASRPGSLAMCVWILAFADLPLVCIGTRTQTLLSPLPVNVFAHRTQLLNHRYRWTVVLTRWLHGIINRVTGRIGDDGCSCRETCCVRARSGKTLFERSRSDEGEQGLRSRSDRPPGCGSGGLRSVGTVIDVLDFGRWRRS